MNVRIKKAASASRHRAPNATKVPNATKHGAFAHIAILPGEDPHEFERLHRGLVDEWHPNGPSEEDAVLTMAVGMWRKARLQKFRWVQLYCGRSEPTHPFYDHEFALRTFCNGIKLNPELIETGLAVLPQKTADQLREKFPRENFESTAAWIAAMTKEVESAMLPGVQKADNLPVELLLDRSAMFLTEEEFNKELAAEERIDGMTDRAMKRLIQAKGIKELLYRAPAPENGKVITSKANKDSNGK
jgi:hypothetical protein